MKENKEQETKTNKDENNETGKFIRISIEADEALSSLHKSINGNADAVKITKVMLASYVLEKHCPSFSDEDTKTLYMRNVSGKYQDCCRMDLADLLKFVGCI